MKQYNIKAIIDNDDLKLIFECDKEKNKQCNKNNCDEYCNYTTDSRYMKAKSRQRNKNITDKEIIINLEKEIEYYREKIERILADNIIINKQQDNSLYNIERMYADNKLVKIIIDFE